MSSFLNQIDIFGIDFKLNLKGKETFNTLIGGIFSIFVFITIIILSWYFGKDIYLKKSPVYLPKILYSNETPMITINSTSPFLFAIHVEDGYGKPMLNESYFHYSLYYDVYSTDIETGIITFEEEKIFNLEKCNTSHYKNETLYGKGLKNYYCTNMEGLTLGGDWKALKIAIFYFYVMKCYPDYAKEKNITCATKKELMNLPTVYVSYFLFDNLLDPTNFENPIEEIQSYNFHILDLFTVYPQYKFYYSMSSLETDQGFFFEDVHRSEFLSYEKLESDNNFNLDPTSFMEISFYLSKRNPLHIRSYIKIPDVVAQVGGILSLFLPFIEFFLKIFIENEYIVYLIKCFFKIQISNNNQSELKDFNFENYKDYNKIVYKFNNDSISIIIDSKAGEEKESFSVTMKAKVAVIAFNRGEIEKLAEAKLMASLPASKELLKFDKDKIEYVLGGYNVNRGSATINASFEGKITLNSNADIIDKSKLLGLNNDQLSAYLKTLPEIASFEINFYPSFINKVPNLVDRINIEVKK